MSKSLLQIIFDVIKSKPLGISASGIVDALDLDKESKATWAKVYPALKELSTTGYVEIRTKQYKGRKYSSYIAIDGADEPATRADIAKINNMLHKALSLLEKINRQSST